MVEQVSPDRAGRFHRMQQLEEDTEAAWERMTQALDRTVVVWLVLEAEGGIVAIPQNRHALGYVADAGIAADEAQNVRVQDGAIRHPLWPSPTAPLEKHSEDETSRAAAAGLSGRLPQEPWFAPRCQAG
jgi:hypothetical protein